MIQSETRLKVVDNSGALEVKCILVLGGSGKRYARPGDVIVCTVKKAIPNSPVKAGTVVKAVVLRTRGRIMRKDGSSLVFFENSCALIADKKKNPVGTSITGSVPREVRDRGFVKFGQIADEVI